jgi:hypothetical protein
VLGMLSALFRPPLVWFAAAETMLIAVLGTVTWHVWLGRTAPPAIPLVAGAPPAAAPPPGVPMPAIDPNQPAALPPTAPAPAPAVGPTPGIRTDADFMSRELSELNRVEATFEDLEWRVTRAVADAIQRYVEGVVLPSIERSERGGR